jgi:hypothetical protein
MRFRIFLFLMAALSVPVSLPAKPTNGLGMWVWSASAFSTQNSRHRLVKFCIDHGITHLDVHVKMSSKAKTTALKDADAFKDLILLAGEHQITTAALRGAPRMFFAEKHPQTLQELQAIIDFSKTLPGDALFKGIKYDVEPYLTKEWKQPGTTRETVMRDYLAFLRKARLVLQDRAPGLWLAVDTPFWWDNDEFIVEFEGSRKRFSEHVQDLTDFIAIMSYRRSPKGILACVDWERRYAKRIHKVIFPSLETTRLKQDPNLSFWGFPPEHFWKVVPQLLEETKTDPAIGGVMLHCYRSLLEKFGRTPPTARGGRGRSAAALDF